MAAKMRRKERAKMVRRRDEDGWREFREVIRDGKCITRTYACRRKKHEARNTQSTSAYTAMLTIRQQATIHCVPHAALF